MKSIPIIFCIVLAALALGYRLAQPMSGFFFRYLRWSVAQRASAVQGQVRSEGSTIHFVSYGSGPPVLLLHGGLSNRLAWFSQIPWLVESGHRVVVLDVRGHGISGLGRKELNYRLLACDAVGVLDQLKIDRTDVIGWSDGGNTALLLGMGWPERVGKMVLISANFNPSGLTPEMLEDTYSQSSGPALWFKRWWTGAGERVSQLERRVKRMWRTFPMLQPDDLRKISAPVLVIVGRHDVVSTAHARKMAEALPHGELEIIPGGHSTPITHSIQVNAAIATFLDVPILGESIP